MSSELKEALAFLIELLELGVDYADANHQTCISFEVDPYRLQQAYDEYSLTNAGYIG